MASSDDIWYYGMDEGLIDRSVILRALHFAEKDDPFWGYAEEFGFASFPTDFYFKQGLKVYFEPSICPDAYWALNEGFKVFTSAEEASSELLDQNTRLSNALSSHANEGRRVVGVVSGDNHEFSKGGEELARLLSQRLGSEPDGTYKFIGARIRNAAVFRRRGYFAGNWLPLRQAPLGNSYVHSHQKGTVTIERFIPAIGKRVGL